MSEVFILILSMSIGGSVLIAACLAAERFGKARTARWWQYYIWLLVLARLLIPFGPDAKLFPENYGTPGTADTARAAHALPQENPAVSAAPADTEPEARRAAENASVSYDTGLNTWDWVSIVWIAGATILLVRKITAYESYIKYVRAGLTPSENIALMDLLAEVGEECGVRRPVELAVNPLVSSPLLIGLVHPCIVLPDDNIPADEFRLIAAHELTHLRRLDIVYKWAVQAAVCVHWFNPLVYLMSRRVSRACEFACDEAVTARGKYGTARQYADTLLNAMAASGPYDEPVAPVQLSANARMLKDRICAVKAYGTRKKWAVPVTVLLTACIFVLTACSGVYRPAIRRDLNSPAAQAVSAAGVAGISIAAFDSCLTVCSSEDDSVHADYDPRWYAVDMTETADGQLNITCSASPDMKGNKMVTLYVPFGKNRGIQIMADSSYIDIPSAPRGNITSDFSDCFVRLNLAQHFDGNAAVLGQDSLIVLGSDTDFDSMNVVLDGLCIGASEAFTQEGESLTLSGGDTANVSVHSTGGAIVAAGSDKDWGSIAADAVQLLPEVIFGVQGSGIVPEDYDDKTLDGTYVTHGLAEALTDRIWTGLRTLLGDILDPLSEEISADVRSALEEAASELHYSGTSDAAVN